MNKLLPWRRRANAARTLPIEDRVAAYVMAPSGELSYLEREDRGLKTVSGSHWSPTTKGAMRELRANDEGRARAYASSVWAFRCANIRAAKVAEQLHKAKMVHRETREADHNHPFIKAVEWAYANYEQDYFFNYAMNDYLYGEVYTELIPLTVDLGGEFPPVVIGGGGVRVLPAVAVEPIIDRGTIVGYEVWDGATQRRLTREQIAYHHTYNPTSTLRGQSTLDTVMDAVNIDMYVVTYSKNYYANGARPGIVFTPREGNLNDADLKNIERAITRKLKGASNFFKPMFLTRSLESTMYESPELEDQSFLTDEVRQRICSAFAVPVGMLTFSDQRFQFSDQQRKSFYEETVIPDIKRIARFIDARVRPYFDPDDQYAFTPDLDDILILLEDRQRLTRIVNSQFESGAITFNERREFLRMEREEHGDFYQFKKGSVFVRADDFAQIEETVNTPEPDSVATPTDNPSMGQQEEAMQRNQGQGSGKTAPQSDPYDELRAWQEKSRKGVQKGLKFVCYHVPEAIQEIVRTRLSLTEEGDREAIAMIFTDARDQLEIEHVHAN